MQVSVLCIVVSALAVTIGVALPVQPDVTHEVEAVHLAPIEDPLVQESETQEDSQEVVVTRERRSPQKTDSKGTIDVGIHREKGVGTVVQAQAERNVWTSKNGNTRVDANGQWSRVFNGPAAGKPNYSGGIRFSHRF